MMTHKELERYNLQGCGELAQRCHNAEIDNEVLLGEFSEYLKEHCDVHVINMIRPFLEKRRK